MKKWLYGPILVVALLGSAQAVDMSNAEVIGKPARCIVEGEMFMCILVEKEERHFKVAYDNDGIAWVYEVEVVDNGEYWGIKSEKLIWSRKSI